MYFASAHVCSSDIPTEACLRFGIKAVIRLNGVGLRGEPPKCGKNALRIAECHTAEAGTAMAPRQRAAGAVLMLLTVGGLMLNNTPLLQNSPATS